MSLNPILCQSTIDKDSINSKGRIGCGEVCLSALSFSVSSSSLKLVSDPSRGEGGGEKLSSEAILRDSTSESFKKKKS